MNAQERAAFESLAHMLRESSPVAHKVMGARKLMKEFNTPPNINPQHEVCLSAAQLQQLRAIIVPQHGAMNAQAVDILLEFLESLTRIIPLPIVKAAPFCSQLELKLHAHAPKNVIIRSVFTIDDATMLRVDGQLLQSALMEWVQHIAQQTEQPMQLIIAAHAAPLQPLCITFTSAHFHETVLQPLHPPILLQLMLQTAGAICAPNGEVIVPLLHPAH